MPLIMAPFLVAAALSTAAGVSQQTSSPGDGRVALVTALERLLTTGEPRDVAHDDGELLQEAVSDAIRRGDVEIERLAMRAAAPIVVRVSRPVASVQSLPALDIDASVVLKLARPVAYEAQILASVDGSELVPIGSVKSGARGGGRIDTGLPRSAAAPGFHRITLRARVAFVPRDERLTPWTETRELPDVAYALYDENSRNHADVRAFLLAHLGASAQHFDSQLPDVTLATWLERTLRPRAGTDGPFMIWQVQFCVERTSESGTAPRTGPLCTVGYFGARGVIAALWFRTGRIDSTQDGMTWTAEEPSFQAISMRESGDDLGPLSSFPDLLDRDAASRPRGDVSIAPDDIVITPGDRANAASVTITMRNQGDAPVHRVFVNVAVAHNTTDRGFARSFVIDIPARGARDITLPVVFSAGYGVVAVLAMQLTEHGTFADWAAFDPSPDDAVAFRVYNGQAAPPGFVDAVRGACSCRGW